MTTLTVPEASARIPGIERPDQAVRDASPIKTFTGDIVPDGVGTDGNLWTRISNPNKADANPTHDLLFGVKTDED